MTMLRRLQTNVHGVKLITRHVHITTPFGSYLVGTQMHHGCAYGTATDNNLSYQEPQLSQQIKEMEDKMQHEINNLKEAWKAYEKSTTYMKEYFNELRNEGYDYTTGPCCLLTGSVAPLRKVLCIAGKQAINKYRLLIYECLRRETKAKKCNQNL